MGVWSWLSGLGPIGLAPNPNISIGRGLACTSEHFSRILQLTLRASHEVGITSEGGREGEWAEKGATCEGVLTAQHVMGNHSLLRCPPTHK